MKKTSAKQQDTTNTSAANAKVGVRKTKCGIAPSKPNTVHHASAAEPQESRAIPESHAATSPQQEAPDRLAGLKSHARLLEAQAEASLERYYLAQANLDAAREKWFEARDQAHDVNKAAAEARLLANPQTTGMDRFAISQMHVERLAALYARQQANAHS